MIKILNVLAMLTVGCAHGSIVDLSTNDDVSDSISSTPLPPLNNTYNIPQIKICTLISKQYIKECVLYQLECEDHSEELLLECIDIPVGIITNPPRPVRQ